MTQVREPDHTNVKLDPNTCEVMDGDQHEALDIEALADSISTLGQLNPVQIIEHADGRRLIAAGRRRWMACKSRSLPLIANVWTCEEEDINLELFARAVRIAENHQRCDPSAMDIAKQMLRIRNERGCKNAFELAEHLGMSEASVKRYLSIIAASDHLQEVASTHSLALGLTLELAKCEKRMGAPAVRKLIDRVVKGELGVNDLSKLRSKPNAPQKTRGIRRAKGQTSIAAASAALLEACAKTPPAELSVHIEGLMAKLARYLPSSEVVA